MTTHDAVAVAGACKKMITERLCHLEDHGMIKREIVATSPVSVEYEITDFVSTAICILNELRQWSENVCLLGADCAELRDRDRPNGPSISEQKRHVRS